MSGFADDRTEIRPRTDPAVIAQVLDWLDNHEAPYAASMPDAARKVHHRDVIRVEIDQADGNRAPFALYTRCLMQQGLSGLLGRLVYPETRCLAHLVTPRGDWQLRPGKVTACNYVLRTTSLYQVVIRFDQPLDLAAFSASAPPTHRHVLLVDDDEQLGRLIDLLLRERGLELTNVHSGQAGVQCATTHAFDLMLLDLELPDVTGLDVLRHVRAAGFAQPVIAISAQCAAVVQQACIDAGCCEFVPKPFERQALVDTVMSFVRPPLNSTLAQDDQMSTLVAQYVAGLPVRVGALQQAFQRQDLDALASVTRLLKSGGSTHGFEPITLAATRLEQALETHSDAATILQGLNDLIGWCRAACPPCTALS